jgi:hypothetical protein
MTMCDHWLWSFDKEQLSTICMHSIVELKRQNLPYLQHHYISNTLTGLPVHLAMYALSVDNDSNHTGWMVE